MVVLNFSHCHSHGWSRRSQLAVCHGLLGMVYHKLICSVFFQVFKVCKKALKFMEVLGNKPNNCTHASTKKNQTIITRNLYTKIFTLFEKECLRPQLTPNSTMLLVLLDNFGKSRAFRPVRIRLHKPDRKA